MPVSKACSLGDGPGAVSHEPQHATAQHQKCVSTGNAMTNQHGMLIALTKFPANQRLCDTPCRLERCRTGCMRARFPFPAKNTHLCEVALEVYCTLNVFERLVHIVLSHCTAVLSHNDAATRVELLLRLHNAWGNNGDAEETEGWCE